ncbi:hypothetical protein [Streptosporangium subroseum]|nr:hypothetical protein [Streptosporangium subroseum]
MTGVQARELGPRDAGAGASELDDLLDRLDRRTTDHQEESSAAQSA